MPCPYLRPCAGRREEASPASPAVWPIPRAAVLRVDPALVPIRVLPKGPSVTAEITYECSGAQAADLARRGLERHGLHVVRSFDLAAGQSDACGCPDHGTARCTCQYSVLLVYPPIGAPAVITVHGRASRTRLEIVVDPNSPPDADLAERIQRVLSEASLALSTRQVTALAEPDPSSPLPIPQPGLKKVARP